MCTFLAAVSPRNKPAYTTHMYARMHMHHSCSTGTVAIYARSDTKVVRVMAFPWAAAGAIRLHCALLIGELVAVLCSFAHCGCVCMGQCEPRCILASPSPHAALHDNKLGLSVRLPHQTTAVFCNCCVAVRKLIVAAQQDACSLFP